MTFSELVRLEGPELCIINYIQEIKNNMGKILDTKRSRCVSFSRAMSEAIWRLVRRQLESYSKMSSGLFAFLCWFQSDSGKMT